MFYSVFTIIFLLNNIVHKYELISIFMGNWGMSPNCAWGPFVKSSFLLNKYFFQIRRCRHNRENHVHVGHIVALVHQCCPESTPCNRSKNNFMEYRTILCSSFLQNIRVALFFENKNLFKIALSYNQETFTQKLQKLWIFQKKITFLQFQTTFFCFILSRSLWEKQG